MQEFESKIKVKPLRRNEGESKFKLYKAALEWGLIDPIVIEKEADLKSKKNWQNKVQPYDHQVKNLITFCRRLPVTLLADDVGLGKTISAGLVMSELMSRNRISRVLIVCPKLLMQQWQEELESKFGIKSSIATGRELVLTDPPDEGATCFICGQYVSDEETWYDKYGIKCLVCQRAVEKRVVPGKICQDKDSWYSMWELDHYFKIKHQTARKLIRQGKLKARIITSQGDDAYCFVFLIKENPILGSKPKSTLIKHEDDRVSVHHQERVVIFD